MLSKKTYYQLKIGRIFELSTQTIPNRVHTASLWSHTAARMPGLTVLHHHAHLRGVGNMCTET